MNYSIPKTSFFLTTVKGLSDKYIRDVVLRNQPEYDNQHAYTIGRTIDTTPQLAVDRIEKSLVRMASTLGMFIDI